MPRWLRVGLGLAAGWSVGMGLGIPACEDRAQDARVVRDQIYVGALTAVPPVRAAAAQPGRRGDARQTQSPES